jgi:hypothetical protein
MRILAVLFAVAILAVAAHAADVSGNWSGKITVTLPDGGTQADTAYLSLKQTANLITGTFGPTLEQQNPISTGKADGNRVIFEVPVPMGVFKFDLSLDGGHLKGDVIAAAQGQTIKATLDATRVK